MVWFIYTGMLYVFLIGIFGNAFADAYVVPISCVSIFVFALIAIGIHTLYARFKKAKPPA